MNIGIIGGGASGMTAAIAAAKNGGSVTILEGNDRIGRKILVTGNGKCNLSNLSFSDKDYHSNDISKVHQVFQTFSVQDTLSFFQEAGLLLKDKNGYVYPLSEQASSVLDVLRYKIEELGITVECGRKVQKLICHNGFQAVCEGKTYHFDRVILAGGGKAAPKTGSDGSGYTLAEALGHSIVPVVPALVQLRCAEKDFSAIAGVRTEVKIRLLADGKCEAAEQGELQLTDYGISGIPVFQLSRFAAYGLAQKKAVTAVIDFLPDYTKEALEELLEKRFARMDTGRSTEQFLTGILHKKLLLFFMKREGISPSRRTDAYSGKQILELLYHMKELEATVSDTNSFQNAQVCAGGISLSEVTKEMESAKVPGLFFAGEILDADGRCGGYNLQWAWSSGYIAGTNAAKQEGKSYASDYTA